MTKAQGTIIIVLLTIIVVAFAGYAFYGGKAQVVKWDYKIVSFEDANIDLKISALGLDGWELAFARRAVSGEGYSSRGLYECIFKRPRSL